MDSPLLDKSLDFATKIVLFYETFSKTRKDTFNELLELVDEIKRMLIASIKTAKENNKAERGL